MSTDRIEKSILLRAPHDRVWRALVDSEEFGTWFGVKFSGPFVPGASMQGKLVGSQVNAEVAEAQRKHAGLTFEWTVEQIQPQSLFSVRWHPHAIDPSKDYSSEPTTLITFTLEDVKDGVLLRVVESGFDQIPLARRAEAFSGNEQGWEIMVKVFEEYLVQKV